MVAAAYSFVELSPQIHPAHLHRVLRLSYASSHAGPVVLWLRGLQERDVAPTLDEAVRSLGLGYRGVEYLADADERRAARIALGASAVVISTETLRPVLKAAGARPVTVEQALASGEARGCFCGACRTRGSATVGMAIA